MSPSSESRPAGRSMAQIIGEATRELEQLTGRPVDSVTSARRDGDGWVLDLEVVELERIPASTSVLGSYRVNVGPDGHVDGYERTYRYYRNQATEADMP